jgi:hypothetical protein
MIIINRSPNLPSEVFDVMTQAIVEQMMILSLILMWKDDFDGKDIGDWIADPMISLIRPNFLIRNHLIEMG